MGPAQVSDAVLSRWLLTGRPAGDLHRWLAHRPANGRSFCLDHLARLRRGTRGSAMCLLVPPAVRSKQEKMVIAGSCGIRAEPRGGVRCGKASMSRRGVVGPGTRDRGRCYLMIMSGPIWRYSISTGGVSGTRQLPEVSGRGRTPCCCGPIATPSEPGLLHAPLPASLHPDSSR